MVMDLLGLETAEPLSGELALEPLPTVDRWESGTMPSRLHHRALTSAGGIAEVLRATEADGVSGCVTVHSEGEERTAALVRADPSWEGGAVGWVRGTNAYGGGRSRLPVLDDAGEFYYGSSLMRYVLGELGYTFTSDKPDGSTRTPLCFVSRSNNGYFFTGYTPATTVRSRFRFPFGAPLLIGWETRLEDGFSAYAFGRSFHEECRVFVEQDAATTVSCVESPSRNVKVKRRLEVTGLERATLRFYRESDALDRPVGMARRTGGFIRGTESDVDFEMSDGGRQAVARDVSGGVLIFW